MSWTVILVLVGGAYGFKALGVLGFGRVGNGSVAARFDPLTALIPAALFAAQIAVKRSPMASRWSSTPGCGALRPVASPCGASQVVVVVILATPGGRDRLRSLADLDLMVQS